jgi:uncharacterized protein YukE
VEYNDLAQIAKIFFDQAEQTRTTLSRLNSEFETLDGGDWVGKGAQKFSGGLIKVLEESGRVTHKIAEIMHQAEEDCASLFQVMAAGAIAAAAPGAAGLQAGIAAAVSAATTELRNQ